MYPNDHRNIHLYMMVTVFNMVFETFSTQSVISTCKELCIGSDRATGVTPSRCHRPGAAQVQRHTDLAMADDAAGGTPPAGTASKLYGAQRPAWCAGSLQPPWRAAACA